MHLPLTLRIKLDEKSCFARLVRERSMAFSSHFLLPWNALLALLLASWGSLIRLDRTLQKENARSRIQETIVHQVDGTLSLSGEPLYVKYVEH
jgi:hypothetical protein